MSDDANSPFLIDGRLIKQQRRSMGPVLRDIGGGDVEIICYQMDFNVQQIPDPRGGGAQIPYPCQALYGFNATGFREVGNHSDLWEFTTVQDVIVKDVGEQKIKVLIRLRGEDIFVVRTQSQLI